MTFWQSMAAVGIGMAGIAIAFLLGGWLVFRAKTIEMPTAFFNPTRSSNKTSNYLPKDLNEFQQIEEPDLSPAAARLRSQRVPPMDSKENVMAFVKGVK